MPPRNSRPRSSRSREDLHEFHVAFEEIVFRQALPLGPGYAGKLEIARLAGEIGHMKEHQASQSLRRVQEVITGDLAADPRIDAEFLVEFASERRAQCFARLDFAAGKFPFERMPAAGFALANQNEAVPLDYRRHHFHHLRRRIHLAIIGTRMHSERLLDHFQNPRNPGELAPPALKVDVTNPACGDMLRLSARFENGRVAEARFLTRGCTASIAASSALTEWMTGKAREELATLVPAVIEDAVGGLEPASKHAAVLCVDALERLLK